MMTKKELITELRKYRCADLSDAMDALGMVDVGVMDEKMRPLRPGIEFKGFAHTVKLLPINHPVVRCGVWGSEITMTMMEKGISGAVIGHHGFPGADSREDALPPAGEARKEMGLNEALRQKQLGFHGGAIHPQRGAGGKRPQADHVCIVVTVVDKDFFGMEKRVSQLFPQLGLGGSPVAAGGHQQGDVNSGGSLPEGLQHGRKNLSAGDGAGVVADDDHGVLLSRRQFLKGRTANGGRHGVGDQTVRLTGLCLFGHQDLVGGKIPLGSLPAVAVRNG